MRVIFGCLGLCVGLLASMAGVAQAQAPGADTIEQRMQQLRPPSERALPPEEAILTGKEDLVLLQRRKLFTLSGNAEYRYTDNAFLSDDFRESDQIFSPNVGLRVATRIAERYDVYAEAQAYAARYKEHPELDFDGFTGRIGGEMPAGSWLLGASYSGSPVYDKGLHNHLVTLHELQLSARRVVPIDRKTALLPSFHLSRIFADPNDFSTVSGDAGVSVVRQLSGEVVGLVGLQAEGRSYDNYFEELTNETRRDLGLSGRLILVWRPTDWFSASGLVELTRNWSTLKVNDYHNISVAPAVHLTAHF